MPPEETATAQPEPSESDRATALLTQSLWEDPRTRPLLAQAIELKKPGSVPGYGLAQLAAKAKDETDKLTKLREREEHRENEALLAKNREGVVRAGLTAADVPAVEELMQKELIGTHATAAEVLRARRQREQIAAPRAHPSTWQIPGRGEAGGNADAFKGLTPATRRDWAKDRAAQILHEFERGNAVGV